MIRGLKVWSTFSTELKEVEALLGRFNDFKLSYIPRRRIVIVDFLFRTTKDFHMDFFLYWLLFFGVTFQTTSCLSNKMNFDVQNKSLSKKVTKMICLNILPQKMM